MKKWMQKLVSQFDIEWAKGSSQKDISEDRATLLYVLDTYNKHMFEIDGHPIRKVRETLDAFAKELLQAEDAEAEKILFKLRQYIGSYRIEENSYVQKTFDDFRHIIWDFVDQLAEDFTDEKKEDRDLKNHLEGLKEAVEANSIDSLKSQAREFINNYVEYQSRKDNRRSKRMDSIKKNLDTVKKQLSDVSSVVNIDHLTKAQNRKSFDEQVRKMKSIFDISKKPMTLLTLDIDHFKKVNDNYGHAIGDFVLQECVKILQAEFARPTDFVARIGGEEFAIILAESGIHESAKRAEATLHRIRSEAFVQDSHTIRFTVSMGLAQLLPNETVDAWMKRSDAALYSSKQNGRNRITIAGLSPVEDVA